MNSRIEYSRGNVPRIVMKLGENEKEKYTYKETEKNIVQRIKMKYKAENKRVQRD